MKYLLRRNAVCLSWPSKRDYHISV